MTETQLRKQSIRRFMQLQYSDERLAMLLAHARDGKLAYFSCCCFIGVPTADHALRGEFSIGQGEFPMEMLHYRMSRELEGAHAAELSFRDLTSDGNQNRVRILIPMIRAEMKRREKLRAIQEITSDAELQNTL